MKLLLTAILCLASINSHAIDHTFNYQGELTDGGVPAGGSTGALYDIAIRAFDAAEFGNTVGDVSVHNGVTVANGLFSIPDVNLGIAIFDGLDIWLQISVKKPADASFTSLTPLQKMTSVPYATTLIDKGAINGQVLTFDNASGWQPVTPASGFEGAFSSLTGVPTGLSDGDDDTQLTEVQVDGYTDNNGYVNTTDTAAWDKNSADDVSSLNDLSNVENSGTSIYIDTAGNNPIGTFSIGIGRGALEDNSANGNIAIGGFALHEITIGKSNIAIGPESLEYNVVGERNVAIGRNSGESNLGSQNVFLGYHAGKNAIGSNMLYIENSSSNFPLIGGDFSTDEVTIHGDLNITGNTKQSYASGGMIKYMVQANCGTSGSTIHREFVGVFGVALATPPATTITIVNGGSAGRCTLTFPSAVNTRFWVVSPSVDNNTSANCIINGTNNLNCRAFVPNTGSGVTTNITVIVY